MAQPTQASDTLLIMIKAQNVAGALQQLENGADISILSDAGGTPLHEASVSGSKELIELLLSKGVDPSVVSKTGKTALDHAIEFKNEAGIRSLTDLK